MIFNNGDRIVFAGNFVTDMGSQVPVGEGLFDNVDRGYVRIVENMLDSMVSRVKYKNYEFRYIAVFNAF